MTTSERYMGLRFQAGSMEFHDLLDAVIAGRKFTSKARDALGAILADLLYLASSSRDGFCFRQMHASHFKGMAVGYRGFTKSLSLLKERGLVDVVEPSKVERGVKGRCTRFRANSHLVDLAKRCGVELSNIDVHLVRLCRPAKVLKPVKCQPCTVRDVCYRPIAKECLPVDLTHPTVAETVRKIEAINAFLSGCAIDPDVHDGFRRIFNEGDHPEFDWDRGGRLYSIGGGYQQMSEADRLALTINGEPVAEIDLKASFSTISHAMQGMPFDPVTAYEITGLPRDVVKAWVNMTLSKDGLTKQWAKGQRDKMLEKGGSDLRRYSAKAVCDAVVNKLPIFEKWPNNSIGWGRLQFIESAIVIDTMFDLHLNGIPALPVHDSIIVPISKQDIASKILKGNFHKRTGVCPVLAIKTV